MLLEVANDCYRQDLGVENIAAPCTNGYIEGMATWRSVRRPGSIDTQDVGRELLAMS
jgi:hypothetical protein